MTCKNIIIKILSFLPALLIMIMIFNFSAENSDDSTSTSQDFTKTFINLVDNGLHLDLSDNEIDTIVDNIMHVVRKLAHFTEYMLLGISLIIPLYLQSLRGKRLLILSELLCVLYAISDEIHQLFVSGRAARFFDVLIDSLGAFTGIIIVCLFILVHHKRINYPR